MVTGTTGTVDGGQPLAGLLPYTGRFAPSPTGDLHIGSLLAAVGSYLDARHHGGRWLVRMEDLDTPRLVAGSADRILRTLEAFGLHWDGEILYQSRRRELYEMALSELTRAGHTFECTCSRRELAGIEAAVYPGTCRRRPAMQNVSAATRFWVPDDSVVLFDDRVQGRCRFSGSELGDVIVRRRDGIHSYQLAVVLDDAAQQVTNVVRGADLLPSTAWQIALQTALALPTPRYAHLPLVVEQTQEKLGKSRHSVPVESALANRNLTIVLRMLGQDVPSELEYGAPQQILALAVRNWNIAALQRIRSISIADTPREK